MNPSGILKNLAWMGGTTLLGQVVTWSATILVARLLTPADYGLVALSGLFTVFAQMVSEMGVGAAVVQRRDITLQQCASLYSLSLLMGAVMTGVGVLTGPLMAWFFNEPKLADLVAFQSFVFLLTAAKSMQRNMLVRETRFDVIGKSETIARIATSGITLLLAWLGAGYWAIAAQWLWIEFFLFLLFCKVKRIRPALHPQLSDIRDLLKFGLGVMVKNIVSQLYALADTAILGKIASTTFLGAYGFAKQLTNMPFEKVVRIINQVLYPYLAQVQGDLHTIRAWTIQAAKLQLLFIVPFFIVLYACAEEAVAILLGDGWSGAVLPLRIFCVANVFKLVESYNMNCLTALGIISTQIRFMVLLLVSISLGMVVLWQMYSPEASIFVWVTIYPLMSFGFSRTLMRAIGLSARELFRAVWPIMAAQGAMAGALLLVQSFTPQTTWGAVATKIGIGLGVYSVMLLLIAPKLIVDLRVILMSKDRSDVTV